MNFAEKHIVEGTDYPTITIGRRLVRSTRTGKTVASRRWCAQWCLGAKQRTRALKVRSKKDAILAAMELYHQLRSGHAPKAIKAITIDELCAGYLETTENKGRAPSTLSSYKNALGRFKEYCKQRGLVGASAFTEDEFWAFKKWLTRTPQLTGKKTKKVGVGERTVYFRLVLVKQLFKWACRTRKIPADYCAAASPREPMARPQPVFTAAQVGQLLAHAPEPWRTLWAMFAWTGMRFGEVRDLEWTDVLLDEGGHGVLVLNKGGSTGDTTKSGKARQVPIHPDLRPMLMALPRRGKQVFLAPPCPKRAGRYGKLNERTVLDELKRHCGACGFPEAKTFKIHSFRHTFLSQLARSKGSERYALDFLGHSSSDVTNLYFKRYDTESERQISTIRYSLPPGAPDRKGASENGAAPEAA